MSEAWIQSTLYFGRGNAADHEWAAFVEADIAPCCPDGFTIVSGHGHWSDPHGTVSDEPASIVVVCHPDTDAWRQALNVVRARYCARFAQQSVLLTRHAVTVDF
jgi:hypothetical protein